jgi:hypothetical protein
VIQQHSIVLEFIGVRQRTVDELAERIRRMNGQKSILVLKTNGVPEGEDDLQCPAVRRCFPIEPLLLEQRQVADLTG